MEPCLLGYFLEDRNAATIKTLTKKDYLAAFLCRGMCLLLPTLSCTSDDFAGMYTIHVVWVLYIFSTNLKPTLRVFNNGLTFAMQLSKLLERGPHF